MNPNDPQSVPQPQPEVVPPVAPAPPQLVPQQPPIPQQPPTPMPAPMTPQQPVMPPKPPRNIKKIIIIVSAVVVGVILLAVAGLFVLQRLGVAVPKYSETQTIELAGSTGVENSGMKFNVPAQMKDKLKTNFEAQLYDYQDDENPDNGWYGSVIANIQVLPVTTLSDEQKQAVIDAFNGDEFADDLNDSDGKTRNLKISNKTATDNNSKFRADLTMDIKASNDEYVSGKGALIAYLEGKYIYVYAYFFTDQVYNANQEFIKTMEASVEVGV